MAGLYIHIPYCTSKCGYCDFYSSTNLSRKTETLDALKREMVLQKDYFGPATQLQTIYIGGGTPTLYSPEELQSLIDHASTLWDISEVKEITIEANPDDMSGKYLDKLSHTNINRLSIGIQSFIDRDLRFMGRRHDSESAKRSVKDAQEKGFCNITIDLIYGIPGMSMDDWKSNLDQALQSGVQHISAYHLTIEENTRFGLMQSQGKISPVADMDSENQYLLLHEILEKNGFEHYEVSNFAKPGFRSVHNSSYWKGTEYLGIGPSAHSFDGKCRRSCRASLGKYLRSKDFKELYDTERLTTKDIYNEFLMTSLRCKEGVDIYLLSEKYGKIKKNYFLSSVDKFVSAGSLEIVNGHVRIPAEKFLISDHVISSLFEVD